MTKQEALSKMNARHGTDHQDFFMLLVWLRRSAERLERKGPLYSDQASELRADYAEALGATESS